MVFYTSAASPPGKESKSVISWHASSTWLYHEDDDAPALPSAMPSVKTSSSEGSWPVVALRPNTMAPLTVVLGSQALCAQYATLPTTAAGAGAADSTLVEDKEGEDEDW